MLVGIALGTVVGVLLPWRLNILVAVLGFVFLAGCDDPPKSTSTVPAAAAPAASSTPPTPEKAAGVEYGSVKLCVVPKGGNGSPSYVNVIVRPIFVESDPPQHDKWFALKPEDGHGFCDFVHPDFSRWWGNQFVMKATDVPLDEAGIYYLKDWKENPAAGDLTYAKAAKMDDGAFVLGVLIASANVPTIQITVKE